MSARCDARGGPVGDLLASNWRDAGADLLHVPSYRRVPLLRTTRRLVATVHDLAPLHLPEKYGVARYHFIRDVVPHIMLRRCDHLLTVTEHTRQDLITSFGIDAERITVTQPGIDHSRFNPGAAPVGVHTTGTGDAENTMGNRAAALARLRAWCPALSTDFVCYTARIEHPGKGHIALLDAWRALAATRQDMPQLVFAGAPCERADEVMRHAEAIGGGGVGDRICAGDAASRSVSRRLWPVRVSKPI